MKNFNFLLVFFLTGAIIVSCTKEAQEEMSPVVDDTSQTTTAASLKLVADLEKAETTLLTFNQTEEFKKTERSTATSRNALPARVQQTVSQSYPNTSIQYYEEYTSIPGDNYRHYSVYLDNGTEFVVFQYGQVLARATIEAQYEATELKAGQLPWNVLVRTYYNYQNDMIEEIEPIGNSAFEIDLKDGRELIINRQGTVIGISQDTDGDDDHVVSSSGNHIAPSSLPANIRNYIATNYPNATITEAERYSNRYEVELSTGVELYFDLAGNLINTSGSGSSSDDDDDGSSSSSSDDDDDGSSSSDGNGNHIDPATLPANIRNYIASNYPGTTITEAEQYTNRYEVELSTGVELYFDLAGNLTNTSGSNSSSDDDDDDGSSSSSSDDDDDDGSSSSSDDDDDDGSSSSSDDDDDDGSNSDNDDDDN